MKQIIGRTLLLFFFLLAIENNLNAQAPAAPSDAEHGFTYDINKAQVLIQDRVFNPTPSNIIAEPIILVAGFPKPEDDNNVLSKYEKTLRSWIESHPDIIIQSLKTRTDIVTEFQR